MSRARGARRPDGPLSAVRPGCPVWVMMLMYVTVGAKWSTDKIQFHGYSVIRFGTGKCRSSTGGRVGAGRPEGWAFHTDEGAAQFASTAGLDVAADMATVLALATVRLSEPAP